MERAAISCIKPIWSVYNQLWFWTVTSLLRKKLMEEQSAQSMLR